MLATLTDAPFDNPEWIFEDKYDGFRMVSEIPAARSRCTAATERSSVIPTSRSRERLKA